MQVQRSSRFAEHLAYAHAALQADTGLEREVGEQIQEAANRRVAGRLDGVLAGRQHVHIEVGTVVVTQGSRSALTGLQPVPCSLTPNVTSGLMVNDSIAT